jgi:CHAD domain-containing protein
MTTTHHEVERKFDVDDAFDLTQVTDLAAASALDTQLLSATYFDTADHRLLHARLTLRRRTGGEDAGWHLKMPLADGSRREVRLPLGRSTRTVPLALRRLVWVHTRDAALLPVVQIDTHRVVRRLVDDDDRVLAEIADDHVEAQRLALSDGEPPKPLQWREIEVELVDGDPALLKRVGRTLRDAGARKSRSASKLGRALGSPAVKPSVTQIGARSTAAEVLTTYQAKQFDQLIENDPEVRLDQPTGIHQMRVATRRLRSALRTFGPLFAAEAVAPLKDELAWLSTELGIARDAQVVQHALDGRAGAALDRELTRSRRAAQADLVAALNSERHQLLVAALSELVASPPFTSLAARRAGKELPRHVARADRAVRRALRAVDGAEDRDAALHHARKAAKRARYAAEAVAGAVGATATRYAGRMERLQGDIGEQHDTVVLRDQLTRLAVDATPAAAFAYGRLDAAEEARGLRAEERVAASWRSVSRKSVRGWLP